MNKTNEAHYALLKRVFPNIRKSAKVTSPETETYNCIAYAAGDQSRWWWPDPVGLFYWPPNVIRLPTLPVFQSAFEAIGFELCANDDFTENYDKIAIYHHKNVPTHAAKLIAPNIWSSKLGKWYDISHSKHCLNHDHPDGYGEIAFFMMRKS